MFSSRKLIQAAAGVQTGNWDISGATLQSSFSFSSDGLSSPQALFFKDDGSSFYITDRDNDRVYQYDLSSDWDITTASLSNNFSVSGQSFFARGLFFKPDGTRMYVSGNNDDEVNEYNLSTAWDLSTASFSRTKSVATEEPVPRDVFFKTDGTRMYVVGSFHNGVDTYNLSTAWNVTTASASSFFSVATEDSDPTGIYLRDDGLKMYIVGQTDDEVHEYDLSTAWDVTTSSLLQSFSVTNEDTTPVTVSFKDDGSVMYVLGDGSNTLYAYDL